MCAPSPLKSPTDCASLHVPSQVSLVDVDAATALSDVAVQVSATADLPVGDDMFVACATCTYRNDVYALSCDVCGAPVVPQESAAGDAGVVAECKSARGKKAGVWGVV